MDSPHPRFRIRSARAEDALSLARVHVESWRSAYAGLLPAAYLDGLSVEDRSRLWEQRLREKASECHTLVLETAGGIAGFTTGGPHRTMGTPFAGELYALYLLLPFRRLGWGSHLLRASAERLQAAGFSSFAAWVLAENPARRFYETLGGYRFEARFQTIGGTRLSEIGYGWPSLQTLLDRPLPPPRDGEEGTPR